LYNLLHSKCYNFQKGFVKALWNSLWTTGNSRWTTSAVPGPHLESTDVVPPYYISGYVPVTIAGQLHFCKDGVFRGPLVTLSHCHAMCGHSCRTPDSCPRNNEIVM